MLEIDDFGLKMAIFGSFLDFFGFRKIEHVSRWLTIFFFYVRKWVPCGYGNSVAPAHFSFLSFFWPKNSKNGQKMTIFLTQKQVFSCFFDDIPSSESDFRAKNDQKWPKTTEKRFPEHI